MNNMNMNEDIHNFTFRRDTDVLPPCFSTPLQGPSAPPVNPQFMEPPMMAPQQFYNAPPSYHHSGPIYPQQSQQPHIIQQQAPTSCTHPNINIHYSFNCCVLACIIILIIEWFPFGLFALFALPLARKYRCPTCGFVKQSESGSTCFFISFGILQCVFIVLFIVIVIFIAVIADTATNTVSYY